MLMKRLDGNGGGPYTSVEKRWRNQELPEAVVAYLKRDFSDDNRKELASSGAALPDGSFPIENKGDLENAIRAIGRAKDPEKAKAHIKARAKALGASDSIPDTWAKRSVPVGKEYSTAADMIGEAALDAGVEEATVMAAHKALTSSMESIVVDGGSSLTKIQKRALITKSFEQCVEFLAGEATDGDAFTAACADALEVAKGETTMTTKALTPEELQKKFDEQTTLIAKQGREIRIMKMSDKHKDYHDKMPAETDGDKKKKEKFADMEPAERDAHMKENPAKDLEDEDEEETEKRILKAAAKADPVIKSLIEKTNKTEAENADLKKRLAVIDEATAVSDFRKRAADLGLPEAHGEVMRKAYAGDKDAIAKHEQMLKGIANQAKTGEVFKEFGSGGGDAGGSTAYEKLKGKAEELRKSEAGKGLSTQQAFAKVYDDPVNKDLREEHKRDEMKKRRAA
jgi:hypothetical protein